MVWVKIQSSIITLVYHNRSLPINEKTKAISLQIQVCKIARSCIYMQGSCISPGAPCKLGKCLCCIFLLSYILITFESRNWLVSWFSFHFSIMTFENLGENWNVTFISQCEMASGIEVLFLNLIRPPIPKSWCIVLYAFAKFSI